MKILMKILWFLPHFVVPVLQQFFFFAAIAIASALVKIGGSML